MIKIPALFNNFLSNYNFIDLFAGIGGFHLALNSFGATCVFASEWDKFSAEVYENNFNMKIAGDITKIEAKLIPNHEILCAGFPCQAFSISGKQHGFLDSRGTLFFDILRITKFHRPRILILENVKNFEKHDNGKTLDFVVSSLNDLNYNINYKVLNASEYGLPHSRKRIFFVCFNKDYPIPPFSFPTPIYKEISVSDILETNPSESLFIERDDIVIKKHEVTSDIFGNYPCKPIRVGTVNKGGQGERIYHPLGHGITLSAYGGGIGAKTGLYLTNGRVRKLSPRECARLQGFPNSFILHESSIQAYKQLGNSLPIDVVQYLVLEICKSLLDEYKEKKNNFRFANCESRISE